MAIPRQKVDKLGELLTKIKKLKTESEDLEKELKGLFGSQLKEKNEEIAVSGYHYVLTFKKGERSSLDTKGLAVHFGDEALEPFKRLTEFVSVKANEL